ncbi:hypothetical protein NQ315_014234 [Exocentrus adspersus]|uniref:Endonuclease/exonuclease/phosphatase domain-containing protein n=1 Tax=Exocentrus adspersus TaxID=1586481 RepID=A0AAV8VCU1_9CUCU|nr:hypothetical protein NQ315_014234 [Exocentrus adspersus]
MIGDSSIAITPATAADYRLITKVLEADRQEYHTNSATGRAPKCGADHETGRCEKPRGGTRPMRQLQWPPIQPAIGGAPSTLSLPRRPHAKKPAATAGGQMQPPRPSAVVVPGKSFAAAAAGTRKPPAAASQAQKGPQVDLAGLVGALSQFQTIIAELQKVAQIMPLLQEFLTRLEIDVVALQETRLAENMSTKIPGYVVYRQDRNRRGGVAVAIKRGVDHYMLQVPQLDTIEAVAVGIRTSRYGEIAVTSCYHPPGRTILEQDIEALLTVGSRVIAIEDFNAKAQDWNSRQLNPSGAALRRFLENTVDVVAIGPVEPTFDGQGRFAPDVLDIALLKAIPVETDITSHHEGSSDHNPVLLTVGDPTPQGDIIVKRNTDWANFRAEMQRSTYRHPANRDD